MTGWWRLWNAGPRSKRPYRITDAGRAAFAAWVSEPPGTETIRFPLLLMLTFGNRIPPGDLAAHLARHRRIHADRLAAYERQRHQMPPELADDDPYALATLDFGIRYERAVLAWFDGLPERIVAPT